MENNNWVELKTGKEVFDRRAEGWEIEFANSSSQIFSTWSGLAWHADRQYRGRPRQPKMKEITQYCYLMMGELHWLANYQKETQLCIRQEHLDMVAKVPE